jgi:hypothetical protein
MFNGCHAPPEDGEAAFAPLLRAIQSRLGPEAPSPQVRLTATALWAFVHGLADLTLSGALGDSRVSVADLANAFNNATGPAS